MSEIKPLGPSLVSYLRSMSPFSNRFTVVKELLENSLDSGAKNIAIKIEKDKTCVSDDGCGIKEMAKIGNRGCTSKIKLPSYCYEEKVENQNGEIFYEEMKENEHKRARGSELSDFLVSFDINKFIKKYGFRGEALACLKECATVEIKSRFRSKTEENDFGWSTILKKSADCVKEEENTANSTKNQLKPVTMPFGTQITITDLFFNNPLRKKKSKTDFKKENEKIQMMCLAYGHMTRIELWVNGNLILDTRPCVDIETISIEISQSERIKRNHAIISKFLFSNLPLQHVPYYKHHEVTKDEIPNLKEKGSTFHLFYALSNKPTLSILLNGRLIENKTMIRVGKERNKRLYEKYAGEKLRNQQNNEKENEMCEKSVISLNQNANFLRSFSLMLFLFDIPADMNVEGKMDVIVSDRVYEKVWDIVDDIEGVYSVSQPKDSKKTQNLSKNVNLQPETTNKIEEMEKFKVYKPLENELPDLFKNISENKVWDNNKNYKEEIYDLKDQEDKITRNLVFVGTSDDLFFVQSASELLVFELSKIIEHKFFKITEYADRNADLGPNGIYFDLDYKIIQFENLEIKIRIPTELKFEFCSFDRDLQLLKPTERNVGSFIKLFQAALLKSHLPCDLFKLLKRKIGLASFFRRLTDLKELYKAFERT